ncbi:MAG: ribbon-helix-helix protein, CopG family [Candidatus Rokubacteria bacterium]|nr:ribbon-helix-helix protein, CopG family [Candidatus Rokubacteria bacterium]
MPTSVRLDPETERLVARLSRRTRRTKSQVIRDAIATVARAEEASRPPSKTAYDALEHLIGVTRGGPHDLSVRTGDKFRRLLVERRRSS